jgi:glycine cleavage system H protein
MRPTDIQYTKEHEWLRMEGDQGVIGVTDFAASELGDIVFIELPSTGASIKAGESLGSIETVKAVEDLYSPVSGVVVDVNVKLEESPELVNEDPYGDGWMVRLQVENLEGAELLSAEEYASEIGEE